MSQQYHSLSAALAAHPDCVGLHLNTNTDSVQLAFGTEPPFEFRCLAVRISDEQQAAEAILRYPHWLVLELQLGNLSADILIEHLSVFKNLKRLSFHYPYGFRKGVLSLDGLPALQEIDLHYVSVRASEPLPQVCSFALNSLVAVDVPQLLSYLNPQVLRQAEFRHCRLVEMPPALFGFEHLERLVLASNKIKTLPPNIIRLKKLTYLNLNNNKIAQLPAEIMQMEQLAHLHLLENPFIKTTEVRSKSVLLKTIRWCADNQTPPHLRKLMLDLMQENIPETEKATVEDLLYALGTDINLIGRKAMNRLVHKLPDPFKNGSVGSGDTVSILGKVKGVTLKDLTAQLKTQGLAVNTKLTEKTTIVCIGGSVENSLLAEITACKLPLALPQHLKEFLFRLETPYLKEADSDAKENLSRLIRSQNENTVKLAAQMMMTGGIPDQLYYQVLILALMRESPYWKPYRAVLERYATTEHYDFVKKHRNRQFLSVLDALFKPNIFDAQDLTKAGLTVFHLPLQNREEHHPFHCYFGCMVKQSFKTGGEAARTALQMLTKDNTLNLFSGMEMASRYRLPKELLAFDNIRAIHCAEQVMQYVSNRKILSQMKNLSKLIVYHPYWRDMNKCYFQDMSSRLEIEFCGYDY